jgi:anti-sigma B factor antagonist
MPETTTAAHLNTHAIVEAHGEIDAYSANRLRAALTDLAVAGRHRIALDMAEVTFMDSSGLGVLIGGVKRAKAGRGVLVLVAPRESILRTLRITGIVKILPVFATMPEAFAYLDAWVPA